jgi:integrase/recombinase XerC
MTEQQIPHPAISEAIELYLKEVKGSRSALTEKSYHDRLSVLTTALLEHGIDPNEKRIDDLKEEHFEWAIKLVRDADLSPGTERLTATAIVGFYEYIEAKHHVLVDTAGVRWYIKRRVRKIGKRVINFVQADVELMIEKAMELDKEPYSTDREHLINLRDRALIITLADTGLRIHEAFKLRRSSLDLSGERLSVIGKGDKGAIVRMSTRSCRVIEEYLKVRTPLFDGKTGKPLGSLPVFLRHDDGSGSRRIKALNTKTGRFIFSQRVQQWLGIDKVGTITPHTMRHYFVTVILRETGDINLAAQLARHSNIMVTAGYANRDNKVLDKKYYTIFNRKDGE